MRDTSIISFLIWLIFAQGAFAGEVNIRAPDTYKQTIENTQAMFERCMGAVASHGNIGTCAAVQNILTQLENLPQTPIAEAPSPSKESEKPPSGEK